jgi:ethanolamine utilization microcompartment shell protein EutS
MRSKIQLSFAINDLQTLTYPQVVLLTNNGNDLRWTEYGRTDVVPNNLNPRFKTAIQIDYAFEATQNIKLVIVNGADRFKRSVDTQENFGECETTLAEIVANNGIKRKLTKLKAETGAMLLIRCEEKSLVTADITFRVRANKLDAMKKFFGSSSPYLNVQSVGTYGQQTVYTSEYIKNRLTVNWKPFTISAEQLCNGDLSKQVRFEVMDKSIFLTGTDKVIGWATTTMNDLLGAKPFSLHLANENKAPSKNSKKKHAGILVFDMVKYEQTYSMIDYLMGGHNINVVTAIDFTEANGNPSKSQSLHFKSKLMNPYQSAIYQISTLLAKYSATQTYPVYGFGARKPLDFGNGAPTWVQAEFFPAMLPTDYNPNVHGVDGIMNAYSHALSTVQLSSPSNFAPVLRAASYHARSASDTAYTILVIYTCGDIDDMKETTAELVLAANDLPLSVM